MIESTITEYKQVMATCKALFEKKTRDYGTAWRILRMPSLTDQILIKAQRVRSIQEKGIQKVNDPIRDEFIGIINYAVMALIQSLLTDDDSLDMSFEDLQPLYDKVTEDTLGLLEKKNHDYSEAWREMRVSSITDIILMKLLRVKQIEDNEGRTIASEGVLANYQDIINYAVFALIKSNHVEGEPHS